MIHVDILCPNEWHDGICDSYESRVYLSHDCKDSAEYRNWLSTTAQEYINNLDEVHGNIFDVYVDYQYKGWIIRQKEEFSRTLKYLQKQRHANTLLQHSIGNITFNGKTSNYKYRICVIDRDQFLHLRWEYDHFNKGFNNSLVGFKDTKEFYMRLVKEPKKILIITYRSDTEQIMDRIAILPRNK